VAPAWWPRQKIVSRCPRLATAWPAKIYQPPTVRIE
jgi:hypothetical protein